MLLRIALNHCSIACMRKCTSERCCPGADERQHISAVLGFCSPSSLPVVLLAHLSMCCWCAPLSFTALMTTFTQIYIPSELVHAVLERMWDCDDNGRIKRGLASCSLTCRYWAAIIRPLLFEELMIHSREEIRQLVAFMDADFLEPTLSKCIQFLNVIEDQASVGPPWSHQLIRLASRLPGLLIDSWTVKGAPTFSNSQHRLARRSPLPFLVLPRTLPRCILHHVESLILSDLSVRCV